MDLNDLDPRSSSGIRHVLGYLDMAPLHRWGQNFLVDRALFDNMADLTVGGTSQVLEIGPGLGGLTLTLLERGAQVLALEIDQRVKPMLEIIGSRFPGHLHVAYEDALKVSWPALCREIGFSAVCVTGNLPYYLTAPLLGQLAEFDFPWTRAVFMVQREVADRLLTDPGHRDTSALSVLLRYDMGILPGIDGIAPRSFLPPPAVFSSVIQLVRKPPLPVERKAFQWVVRAGFRHRRKMLRHALAHTGEFSWGKSAWRELLNTLDISPSARAEELSLEAWTRLAAAIAQKRGNGRDDI